MSVKTPPQFHSALPAPTVRIFTDFDGTVTHEDIGEALFRHFCGAECFEDIRGRWTAGELTAPEAYGRLCANSPGLTEEALRRFLDPYHVDPSFPRFAHWCGEAGYPLYILSDGVDAYIRPLLERADVDLPVLCNLLELGGEHPVMHFPHYDSRCPEIAHCKSNHVALLSRDEDLIVYVGDGSSDYEAAQYADLVFARGSLERFCQEQNVTFRRFYNFATVRDQLSVMLHQKTLRKRKRAEVRRQQLWSRG